MHAPWYKQAFWAAAVIAAAAECAVVYKQWPEPPLKVCASRELGELLAAAARTEAELRAVRGRLRSDPDDALTKEVMRMEADSAAAMIAVAKYKERAQVEQKASGKKAGADGACS